MKDSEPAKAPIGSNGAKPPSNAAEPQDGIVHDLTFIINFQGQAIRSTLIIASNRAQYNEDILSDQNSQCLVKLYQ